MWDLAHGRDDRPVVADREAKSVSTETTFARDIADREVLRSWLLELVEQLGQRIRQIGVRTRTVELKLRSADFRTHTRSLTLSTPTDVTDLLWKAAAELFEKRIARTMLPARLLGVAASGLVRQGDAQLCRELTATLCRKRPSPLLRGKANTWACGIIHAVGMVNFLFDSSQTPHIEARQIWE